MSATTELILALRRRGLSQSEIARRTAIPQPRLSRWESGDTPDSADDALKLHALHAELVLAQQSTPEPKTLQPEAGHAA